MKYKKLLKGIRNAEGFIYELIFSDNVPQEEKEIWIQQLKNNVLKMKECYIEANPHAPLIAKLQAEREMTLNYE